MPCIQIKTNVEAAKDVADRIKAGLGQAIAFLPGKSEDWLMVAIEDHCRMYFGGETGRPIAIAEVKILGNTVDHEGAEKMTGEMTRILGETLGVAPKDLYIKY
ncbi:MAG: hypothetical protein LUH04_07735, partial [Clostridium sp.]|nr:hypothetical protein [Clostridium sp.]